MHIAPSRAWRAAHQAAWQRLTVCPRGAQYMDRIYVKHNDKAPVHQLGLDLWRDCVVRRRDTRERLLLLLLGNVRKERQGEVIDRALMRSITMVRTDLPTHRVICPCTTCLLYRRALEGAEG